MSHVLATDGNTLIHFIFLQALCPLHYFSVLSSRMERSCQFYVNRKAILPATSINCSLYIVPVETVLLFSISSFSLLHAEQTQQRAMFPISTAPRSLTIAVIVPHCRNPPLRLQLRSPPRCSFQPMLIQILSQPNHIFRAINCGLLSISSCSYR